MAVIGDGLVSLVLVLWAESGALAELLALV
jgi:hypothetical protein